MKFAGREEPMFVKGILELKKYLDGRSTFVAYQWMVGQIQQRSDLSISKISHYRSNAGHEDISLRCVRHAGERGFSPAF